MAKWEMVAFDKAVIDATKHGTKVKKEDYLASGKYPIIDQGKEFVAGFTDVVTGAYDDVPAIIFGDHTRILKYVDFPFFLGADGVKLLKVSRCDFSSKFVYYYLVSSRIPDTGYNRHFKWLKETQIPLPPLPVQQQIADVLDRASALIEKRKAQIAKLDLLIKSQFIEMFGDPVTNPKGWEERSFHTICENLDSLRRPITASERTAGPIPYYGASGIVDYVDGHIFDEPLLLVSEDGANLLARVTPIAFSVNGKVWVNNHAHVLRFESFSTQLYIEYYLNAIDLSIYITGSAQPKLNQANLNSISIPLPPLSARNDFAAFVNKVEAQKSLLQQAAAKLELNYKSLMQKCFRGELF